MSDEKPQYWTCQHNAMSRTKCTICTDESSFAAPRLLGCGVCGGKLIEIRGRHPRDKPRQVCPTCLAERMDMIREMSAADYGMAYEAHPNDRNSATADAEATNTPERLAAVR